VAAWPPEQQGDASMKTILVGVAFATLMTSPLFAQPQTTERPPHSRVYLEQKKQLRSAYGGFDAWNSNRPTFNPAPMKQGLCSTAPSFCPGYHGSNGG
jgi:hypothetical protein